MRGFTWIRVEWYDALHKRWIMQRKYPNGPPTDKNEGRNEPRIVPTGATEPFPLPLSVIAENDLFSYDVARIGIVLPQEDLRRPYAIVWSPAVSLVPGEISRVEVRYDKSREKIFIKNLMKRPLVLFKGAYDQVTRENGEEDIALLWSRIQWFEPEIQTWVLQHRHRQGPFGGTSTVLLETEILPGAVKGFDLPLRIIRDAVPDDVDKVRVGVRLENGGSDDLVVWSAEFALGDGDAKALFGNRYPESRVDARLGIRCSLEFLTRCVEASPSATAFKKKMRNETRTILFGSDSPLIFVVVQEKGKPFCNSQQLELSISYQGEVFRGCGMGLRDCQIQESVTGPFILREYTGQCLEELLSELGS
ncbi:MAG: hypothetical protein V1913_04670 [Fibrobacterota bacterium]